MSNKFDTVPLEYDTKLLFQEIGKLGDYDVLYQKWFWAGITAESLIFSNEDIADISHKELEHEVKTSPLVKQDSSITIKSDSGFTFVNFNFLSD
jgi:hypothetical protein